MKMKDEYTPIKTIIANLKSQLEFRGIEIPSDNEKGGNSVLEYEINRAIGEINRCRSYKPTEEKPYDKRYENLIIPMCIFSLSKVGIEGETSHSENGVQRIYKGDSDYPEDLIKKIVPLAK